MRIVCPRDYRRMPWKDGGGTTAEIAVFPADSSVSGKPFAWRLSIADVTASGPFSLYPGCDRHIMLIEGNGMILDAGGNGRLDLSVRYRPCRFPGEWAIQGRLFGGPVRDFNVMSRRDANRSSLSVETVPNEASFEAGGATLALYILEGAARDLPRGATAIVEPGETLRLAPADASLRVAVVRFESVGAAPA